MSRIVAIVGRPNVGKSTLFNRLTGEFKAIVDDYSGVTRDRHYGFSDWNGIDFTVIDTGGFVPESSYTFEAAIRDQVHIAIEEAAALIFVVDVQTDVNPLDEEFAHILRKSKKPVVLCVNKVDNDRLRMETASFYSLGFTISMRFRRQMALAQAICWMKWWNTCAMKSQISCTSPTCQELPS